MMNTTATLSKIFTLLLLTVCLAACKTDINTKKNATGNSGNSKGKAEMQVIHHYAVKMDNGKVLRDTLKDCFSCNQALVLDKTGKELELRFYKANMTDLYGYEVYQYDPANQKTGGEYYENDTLSTKYVYETDAEGRVTKGTAYNVKLNKMLYAYTNQFNEAGQHTSTGNIDSNEDIYEYNRRVFNKNGIVTNETIEDLQGNISLRTRYEYRPKADSSWVEQLTFYNGVLREIRLKESLPISGKLN